MTPTNRRTDPPSSKKKKASGARSPGKEARQSASSESPLPITPQPAVADRLRLFEAVCEGSMAGIYVFRDSKFIYVNPALAEIFGYERDELVGKVGPADLTHPDDRSKVAEYIRRRMAGEVKSVHYTFRGVRKDGGLIQCEVLGQAVDLDEGPAVAGTLFDITERERTQRDLRESEALFRSLALKSPSAIFVNREGRVVFVNRAAVELTGYSETELTDPGFSFMELTSPDSLAKVEENLREKMQGKDIEPYEFGLVRKDGGLAESIIATRLISYQGEPAILGVVTDVSERKAAERELRRILQEERRHRKLAEAVARVGLSLTSELELPELLDLISKESTEVFDVSSAFVWMVEGDDLVGFAGYGMGIEQFVGQKLSLSEQESLASNVVREARPIYVNRASSSQLPNQKLLELFNVQSILGVPLIRAGKPEGTLVLLDSSDPEHFKDEDLEMAMVLGAQMAIAIENAQFVRRERRRLQQLTALIESSSVISSTLDLDTILPRIAEEMCKAIDATSAYICTYDPETRKSTVVAEYYTASATERESDLGQTYNLETEFPGTVEDIEARTPAVIQVDDPELSEAERSHLIHFGGKSTVTIPFEIGGRVPAFAEIWESRTRREFSEEEIELVLTIGRQAAIAIEHGRLYRRAQEELVERRRAESALAITVAQLERAVIDAERLAATQEALRDSAAAVSGTLDLDEVLDRILANVGRVVPSDTVDIMLLQHETSGDVLAGVRGRGYVDRGLAGWLESLRLPVDDVPNFQRIVRSAQPYAISAVRDAEGWVEFPGTEWIQSYAAAPIKSKGQVVGILNLCSETAGFYSQAHADVLQSFADQAAVAIDNARLFAQARQELADRQRAEQELMVLSEFNASILEEMADGVVVRDGQGNYTYVNPAAAALFGYAPDEIIGQHWTRFIPADQRPLVQLADERRLRGRSDRYEIELENKSGKRIPILVSGRPRSEDGEFAGTISVFTDITERKRSEEAERAFLRTKEDFLVSASHSLRTPMHTLMGFLELLAGGQVDDPEVQKDFLERALQDAQHLAGLVEDVVGTARMEAGSVELDLQAMPVGQLIADTLQSYEAFAQQKGIRLSWEAPDSKARFRVDRARLRQALGNLVENAIQYSDEGMTVRVETERTDLGTEIHVIDQGPGLSKGDQVVIFEKPYLRSNARQGKPVTAGLGLYLTRTIVEAHGGSVRVESEPGKGSAFTIFIPGDR